jgi:hypothetical protein
VGPDVTGYQAEPPLPDGPSYPGGLAEPPQPGDPSYPGGLAEPPPGGPSYPAGLAEPAEDFTAGYAAEPAPGFAAERGARHSRPPTGRRSGGHRAQEEAGYPEDPHPYPGEPAYADEPADGYLGDDTVLAPGHPGYLDEQDDYQRYPEELPPAGYDSPVRPYVTDTDDMDLPFAEDAPERRTPRGRRRAGPSSDSFPYGPPAAGDEPRQRGHYPGRR